ncbi:MAG: 1-phosphofructokinase family hexose kinase, partial [Erysipelotrichaceae bacterium]|nr:1-phosphofructokinase family hexose kinase [Erysipelotrichaceae bacterium]
MIYTCTTNPSLDYFISLPELHRGLDNRSDMELFEAGGKGVNVSIVLNNFHIPNVALGFLGGFTKDYYLNFITDYPYIQPLFTTIKDNTRINVKIMDKEVQTDINAKGPHITDEEFNKFRQRLNNVYAGDYFILSGNIEEEIKDKMVDVIHELAQENVRIILDTDLDILKKCLDTRIYAVKLNDSNTKEDILKEGKELIEKGAEYVLYSAPDKNPYLFGKDEILT